MMTFPDWLSSQSWKTAQIAAPHQKLMLALARAGQDVDLTRAEIAGLVDLERVTLDDLLVALVRSGELALSHGNGGQRVYRRLI